MKKDPITRIRSFCYLLLWLLPILYFILLAVLNKMGYSLRMFPKQWMYIGYILLLLVTFVLRMAKAKRILPGIVIILYTIGVGSLMPKGNEKLVLYEDTLCVLEVHDVWLETYPRVYYYRVKNWFLTDNHVIYSYRLTR